MTENLKQPTKKIIKKIIRRVVKKADDNHQVIAQENTNNQQNQLENQASLEHQNPAPLGNQEQTHQEDKLGMASMFSRMMEGQGAITEEDYKIQEEIVKKEQLILEEEKKLLLAKAATQKAYETNAKFDESGWGGYFFEFASAAFFVVCQNQIIYVNKKAPELLHYRFESDLLEKKFIDFIDDSSKSLFENSIEILLEEHKTIGIRLVGNGGRKIDVVISARHVLDDNYFTYLIEAVDITPLRKLEEKNQKNEELLIKASGYDTITNLPERKFFDDRLEKLIARSLRFADGKLEKIRTLVAILIVDIDAFSEIEKLYGKTTADKLLAAIAVRLSSCVDEADTVAKNQDGDQFLLIIEGYPSSNRIITTEDDIKNIAEYILKTLKKPFNIMGEDIEIRCSIGISYFPKHGRTSPLLLRIAQSALDAIKSSGGNQYLIAG
ncbi:MAG: diguanylate cyclase [Alphaproteobacteria bacterium]